MIGGIFVCASWGLRATDRVISIDAGPDDTGSIAPPDSAWNGSLCNKWTTGGTLYAQATHRFSLRSEAGSPYGELTYSRLKLLQLAAGSPMLPYSPYSPAVSPPLSGRLHLVAARRFFGYAGGPGLSPGLYAPGSAGGMRTPATAATVGSSAPGLGTPLDMSRPRPDRP